MAATAGQFLASLALARGSWGQRLLLAAAYFILAGFLFLFAELAAVPPDEPERVRQVLTWHCTNHPGPVAGFFAVAVLLWTAGAFLLLQPFPATAAAWCHALPWLCAAPAVYFLLRTGLVATAFGPLGDVHRWLHAAL